MAESMASLLECPICLNSFTDPRMLTCLHTLCYKCLDDLIKHSGQNKQFQCPVDRKFLQIPEDGADAFPKNFFVNSYMAAVTDAGTGARSKTTVPIGEGQQERETRCSNSVDGEECSKAEHFCPDCCEYYCNACSKAHRRSKIARRHVQVTLDDLTDEMLRDATTKSETPRCLKHQKKLKLYCSTCKCAVCAVCCHVGHQSHIFREITDVDEDLKSELGELMTTLQKLMDEVKQQNSQNNQSKQRLDNSTSSARATTKDIFQKMQKMLDQKAKEIDQTISQINTDGGANVDTQNKNLTLHTQLLDSLHTFVDDLLKRGTVYNRLVSLPEVRNRLQDFQGSHLDPAGITTQEQTLSSDGLVAKQLDGLMLEQTVKLGGTGSKRGPTLKIKINCCIEPEQMPYVDFPRMADPNNQSKRSRPSTGEGTSHKATASLVGATSPTGAGRTSRMPTDTNQSASLGPDDAGSLHVSGGEYQSELQGERGKSSSRHNYIAQQYTEAKQMPSYLPNSNADGQTSIAMYGALLSDHTVIVYEEDITKVLVDAIVTVASPNMTHHTRVSGKHTREARAAGNRMGRECRDIIKQRGYNSIRETQVEITTGGSLCLKVIHAVAPAMSFSHDRAASDDDIRGALQMTFYNCLDAADSAKMTSVAIPAIGSGHSRLPKSLVAKALCKAVSDYCTTIGNNGTLKEIHLVDIDSKQTFETNLCFQTSQLFAHNSITRPSESTPMHGNSLAPLQSMQNPVESDRNKGNQPRSTKDQGASSSTKDPSTLDRDKCPICYDALTAKTKKTLSKCGHNFCKECIDQAFKIKKACPVCDVLYGMITGNQPTNGTMKVRIDRNTHLSGYGGCGTIMIDYDFPAGVQSSEHPNPGRRYNSTHRTAYLPHNREGRQVLELLKRAFAGRLVFTIGQSVTTGLGDQVTWNGIHHKTSMTGGSFGYPDSTYLKRVTDQLATKGIKIKKESARESRSTAEEWFDG